MSQRDRQPLDDTLDDAGDPLLRALAWTPKVAPFRGTARYRVVSCLGEGGFGVVYEVEDAELGRRVALKTLKPQRSGFAANVQRLKREFRSVADLVHPNLVGLHELSSDGGRWFFTMELVRGVDLVSYVRGDEQRLRDCLRQLAAGVSALHEAGIVHRDLKPSNVLVEPGGRVVILDFGLADGEEPDDRDLAGAGTPVYRAPEAATGRVGPAADWYAVGVMLYEVLSGRRPFDASARAGDPVPPSVQVPTPPDLERLCLTLLRRDPRARTGGAEMRALFGDGGAVAVERWTPAPGLFVGRSAELAALQAAHAEVVRGEPRLVRLRGEPGVGKSTLLARFHDLVTAGGHTVVLAGRCHERESVPFKAFDGVMDALARYLHELPRSQAAGLLPRDSHLAAQLFPVLDGLPALRELFTRIADRQPLVILIDDLQWGDIDSARLLAQVVTSPDRPGVLVILAYRDEDGDKNPSLRETLRAIAAAGVASQEIALAPLPPRDAEELAVSLLEATHAGRASLEVARSIAGRGEGHPLFIAELTRAHLSADTHEGPVPTLLDILWQRVLRLSASARSLLETVAFAGHPLPSNLCFEAAGLAEAGIDAARVLRAEQMVRAGDRGELNVFHDRVRDAVLLRSDEPTRRRRHLALARAIERGVAPDLEALARHFDAAEEYEQAALYAVRAADAAMAGLAFERAAALYQMAIDRGGAAAELYERLGLALRDAGRSVAAGEAFLAAAGRVDDDRRRRVDLTRLAAEHMLVVGNAAAGLEVLRQALDEVGETIPRSNRQALRMLIGHLLRARLRSSRFRRREEAAVGSEELLRLDVLESACKGLEPTDSFRAMGLRARHYREALRAGEPRRAARAMVGATPSLISFAGSLPPVIDELLDAADDIGNQLADPEILGRSLAARGMIRFFFNEWAAGAELSERAATFIAERCRGMASEQHDALLMAAMCHLQGGRLQPAQRLGDTLRLWAVERGDVVYQKQIAAAVLAPLALAADDVDRAERLLAEAGDEPRCASIFLQAEALAAIAMYRQRPREAIAAWRERWPRIEELGIMTAAGLRTRVVRSLAVSLVAAGDGRRDARQAAGLARSLRRTRFPAGIGARTLVRAQQLIRDGRPSEAAARLAETAGLFDQGGMPHAAAACRRRRGELIGGDDGAREVAAADQQLRAIGIANPERWSATVAPPLARPGGRLVEFDRGKA